MKKILTIVGARPQFIKAAMVSKAIVEHGSGIEEIILHTGQHYDANMSDVFFDQMGIPKPQIQLDCGGGTHAEMTAKIMIGVEKAILDHKPDLLMVYGDTNSTIAGALAAVKQHVKVAHVEAGLRAFDLSLPEEVNRVLTDRISDLLFCPVAQAVEFLSKEGITKGVYNVGDVMYDSAVQFAKIADKQSHVLEDLGLSPRKYFLATVHRQENTDDPIRLQTIFETMNSHSSPNAPIVLPLHPRTLKLLKNIGMLDPSFVLGEENKNVRTRNLRLISPIGFMDMVRLEKNCIGILTDSGGVQKEAYFQGVPCMTFHYLTAWRETVAHGWNRLVDADQKKISEAFNWLMDNNAIRTSIPDFGDGHACEKIVEIINSKF